jgi:hypothetical protein
LHAGHPATRKKTDIAGQFSSNGTSDNEPLCASSGVNEPQYGHGDPSRCLRMQKLGNKNAQRVKKKDLTTHSQKLDRQR